jgi:hypothetical protein
MKLKVVQNYINVMEEKLFDKRDLTTDDKAKLKDIAA